MTQLTPPTSPSNGAAPARVCPAEGTVTQKVVRTVAQAAALTAALLCSQTASAQTRGELLYSTHCVACHSTQMHWRDKKQVLDWTSLRAQVRFWQAQAMLGWNDDDIGQVARYLNDTYYRMPPPAEVTSRVTSRVTGGLVMPGASRLHPAPPRAAAPSF